MREDQDAEVTRGLDEARRRDRRRSRRMAEAVPAHRPGIRAVEPVLDGALVDRRRSRLLAPRRCRPRRPLRCRRRSRCRSPRRRAASRRWLREHARERVDLVPAKLGARRRVRQVLGEHALEAEHQAVAHLPARRRLRMALLDLVERVVERHPAGGAPGRARRQGPRPRAGAARRTTPRRVAPQRSKCSGVSDVSVAVIVTSCIQAARAAVLLASEESTLA